MAEPRKDFALLQYKRNLFCHNILSVSIELQFGGMVFRNGFGFGFSQFLLKTPVYIVRLNLEGETQKEYHCLSSIY